MYYNLEVLKSFCLIYATATVKINMNEHDNHKGQRHRTISFPQIRTMKDQLEAIADYYWVCEEKKRRKKVRATLPKDWKGIVLD